MRCIRLILLFVATATCLSLPSVRGEDSPAHRSPFRVGLGKSDITPDYPIRLSGFGFRRTESEGITQRIWAKAIAVDDGQSGSAVLITTDNLGVPEAVGREVAARLKKQAQVAPGRLTITASHTHTAPMLKGVCATLYGQPIPPDHQAHIDRYTTEFTDKLTAAALQALTDLQPARLEWSIGQVGFAMNRRTPGGPVDHDLPTLVVRDPKGKIRAVLATYACHCVTLSHNRVSGDWAGYAEEEIEKNHPGAMALISVGCGGDQNPNSGVTGDKVEIAATQGRDIATEVERLLEGTWRSLDGPLVIRGERLVLPFDTPPTREQWATLARKTDAIGYHAQVQLARLDRGEKLQENLDYLVQTWAFGKQLAMVFLPGEVVVDYALRLKRELDGTRLWIHAYANDAPCYIPSERILKVGGYEGGGAMVYYDRPTRLKAGLEQIIVAAVLRQIKDDFVADGTATATNSSK